MSSRRLISAVLTVAGIVAATALLGLGDAPLTPAQARSNTPSMVYDAGSFESRQRLIARLALTSTHLREARGLYAPLETYVAKLSRRCTSLLEDPRCTPELVQYGLIVQAGDVRARRDHLSEAQRAQLDRELIAAFEALSGRGVVSLTPEQALAVAHANAQDESDADGRWDPQARQAYQARAMEARRRDALLLAKRDQMQRRARYRALLLLG